MEEKDICKESTYNELFKTLSKTLRNFLLYKGSEVEQANDIVQDSFIKLWENCKKVLPEKAKSYLYTMAYNAFKNEMAHFKVKLKYVESSNTSSANIETPEFQMEEQEFRKKLNDAIEKMPPKQREVFLMNRIENIKYREMADLLGVSVKAIEKRMGKALKHIKAHITSFK